MSNQIDDELMRKYAQRYEYLRNRIYRQKGKLWVAMGDFPGGISHWNGVDLDHQIDREIEADSYNNAIRRRILSQYTSNNQAMHDMKIDNNPLSQTYGKNISPFK